MFELEYAFKFPFIFQMNPKNKKIIDISPFPLLKTIKGLNHYSYKKNENESEIDVD